MKQFGAFEAKTHFSELLAEVIHGETFVITKHGVQVAMIIPFRKEEIKADPINDAIRAIKNLSKGTKLGKDLSIRKMRELGRK